MKVTPKTINAPDGRIFSLTVGKVYEVLGIEDGWYRIMTDGDHPSEPCLFESECFEIIDPEEPSFWISEIDEDGDKDSCPLEWKKPYFFEDFFEKDSLAVEMFWSGLKKYYPDVWKEKKANQSIDPIVTTPVD